MGIPPYSTFGACLRPRLLRAVTCATLAVAAVDDDARSIVADRVMTLTRESSWRRVAVVQVAFRTYHPQGMVKIGETFYVSSVEVKSPTQGVGHLFKLDAAGKLIADLRLGQGAIYHPGGIDFDGTSIWVPVAEYRPNSRTIVYRVDPVAMKAAEAFRVADHIGAIVRDVDDGSIHGVSWGSRRFYHWTPAGDETSVAENPSHYVDYQDCKYAGRHRMVCTGVTEIRQPGAQPFRLGGLDLIDLRDNRPLHQVPVMLWTAGGLDMTHNPVWLEPGAAGLRAYFMPEDDASTIYVYEVGAR